MNYSELMIDSVLKEGIEWMNKCLSYHVPPEEIANIKNHRRKLELLHKARDIEHNYEIFSTLCSEYTKQKDWIKTATFTHKLLAYESELKEIYAELKEMEEEAK